MRTAPGVSGATMRDVLNATVFVAAKLAAAWNEAVAIAHAQH